MLGTFADEVLPEEVIGSIEVDVAFLDDPANEKSDKVDGAIGELSQFHETYQYYAQGVSTSTAVLGPGWEDRLVVFENASTKPGRGLCLDPHDCVAAKLVAGRDKDFEFAAALLREELVDAAHNHRKDRGPPGPVQPEAAPLQLGEGESGKGTGHLAFSAVSSTRLSCDARCAQAFQIGKHAKATWRNTRRRLIVPTSDAGHLGRQISRLGPTRSMRTTSATSSIL